MKVRIEMKNLNRLVGVLSAFVFFICAILMFPGSRKGLIGITEHLFAFSLSMDGITKFSIVTVCCVALVDFYVFFLRKELAAIKIGATDTTSNNYIDCENKITLQLSLNIIRNNYLLILGTLIVLVFMYVFFVVVKPYVPYANDIFILVAGLGGRRGALPNPLLWNPSRVLPETLIPVVTDIFYSLTDNFVDSVSLPNGIIITLLCGLLYIALYFMLLSLHKNKMFSFSVSLTFFILCFLIFITKQDSTYLFSSYDIVCSYCYTIPNIANSIIVCWFLKLRIQNKPILNKNNLLKMGPFILVICYFAIFSVLQSAVVLGSFCIATLLVSIISSDEKMSMMSKIKACMKKSEFKIYCIILIAFVVYMILEVSGPRANSGVIPLFSKAYLHAFILTLKSFFGLIKQINFYFILFCIIAIIIASLIYIKDKNPIKRVFLDAFLLCAISGLLCFVMDICVNAKSIAWISCEVDHIFGIFFYMLVSISISCSYILKNIPKIFLIVPLIMIVLFVECQKYNFRIGGQPSPTISQMKYIVNQWVEQIREADMHYEDTVTIKMPVGGPVNAAIGWALYRINAISRNLKINVVQQELSDFFKK